MSQKKKLILGPLPEELDLSQYEETVTRWDRVIGVVLVGIILISALIYIFLPKAEQVIEHASPSDEAQSAVLAESHKAPEKLLAVSEEPVFAAEETVEIFEKTTPVAEQGKIEKSSAVAESVAPAQPVQESSKETSSAGSQSSSVDSPSSVDSQSSSDQMQDTSSELAEVSIKHPGLAQAVLTRELKNKEPGSALPAEITLPESGITKVILFTEMQGLRGKTLFHDWYRNGVRQARVKIPVNGQTQRSFSSKFINTQMTGEWQVKVVDAKSTGYVEAEFKVLAP